jgi:hypothetical protein
MKNIINSLHASTHILRLCVYRHSKLVVITSMRRPAGKCDYYGQTMVV